MPLALRLLAIGCVFAGLTHVFMGQSADIMLGADISADTLADPSLDSQNRFYGAAFTLYGLLFWLCASDVARYRTVLSLVLAAFFFGGIARIISLATHGWPSPSVIGLAASELIIPPLLALWLARRA